MITNLAVLTHTHTDCSDLWSIYTHLYSIYCDKLKHYYLVNKPSGFKNEIFYDEKLAYTERLKKALEHIEEEFVIIDFEDMFLKNNVMLNELNNIIQIIKKEDIAFVRLIKSGIFGESNYYGDKLFIIDDSDYQLSLVPSIWKKEILLNKMFYFKDMSIWELETSSYILTQDKKWKGLYYYNNEKPIGNHFDSSIYPHICSAIYKGKWNMRDYKEDLLDISLKFNIDLSIRGYYA